MNKRLKVFEAFSGIGTQRMALNRLNVPFEVVGVSEIDKDAIQSYEAIHGRTKNLGDISTIDIHNVPEHNLFTYTFPCQDISLDGKQRGFSDESETRSSLLWEAMRIIDGMKPMFLVAENVINILSKKFKDDFDKWIKRLDDMGYNTYYKKINSRDFGVPQNRERVFCVSIRKDVDDGSFQFPKSIPLNRTLLDLLEDNVGDEYYLQDDWKDKLVYRDDNQTIVDNKLKIKNATAQGYLFAKHGDGVDTAYATSKTRRGRVQEARIQTLTTKYKNYTVLICEESNPTEESFKLRFLTPLEYWRAMGIRDEDYLKAKKSGVSDFCLYNQAGNAIVVDVLSHIFQKIVDMYYK